MFNELAQLFSPIPVMELKAIWLKIYGIEIMQLQDNGSYWKIKTSRIAKGDRVTITNSELKTLDGEPTHQITSTMGTASTATSDFSITVIDLKTKELSHIKI